MIHFQFYQRSIDGTGSNKKDRKPVLLFHRRWWHRTLHGKLSGHKNIV